MAVATARTGTLGLHGWASESLAPTQPTWLCVLLCYVPASMKAIDRARLKSLMQREQQRFVSERPKSKALFERAGKSLLGGVPMNWMIKWAGAFPPFVRETQGAQF